MPTQNGHDGALVPVFQSPLSVSTIKYQPPPKIINFLSNQIKLILKPGLYSVIHTIFITFYDKS